MLIEYCLLRCFCKNVLICVVLAAILNAQIWVLFYIGCNWGLSEVYREADNIPNPHLTDYIYSYLIGTLIATIISLIPATLFGIVYSLRRSKYTQPSNTASL